MKPKTTLTLAAILVVLAAIAAFSQYNRRQAFSGSGKPVFPSFSAEKTDGIDIDARQKPVKLRRQGAKWVVATEGWHEADPKLPQQILDAMGKFTSSNLISTAADKRSEFSVDSSGVAVRLLQGSKPLASFVVGKAGPDFMSTYVRPEGENPVYLIPVYLRSVVDRGEQSWRKTTLLDFKPDAITSFTMKNPKETVTLEKDAGGGWKITAPFESPAKTEIMGFVVNSLCQINASGFADSTLSPEAAGLVPDTTDITVHTSDGSTHTIVIGKTGDRNQSYTKVDEDPTIFLVPRGRWNTVFRPSAALKAEGPTGTPMGGAPVGGAPSIAPPPTGKGGTKPPGGGKK